MAAKYFSQIFGTFILRFATSFDLDFSPTS